MKLPLVTRREYERVVQLEKEWRERAVRLEVENAQYKLTISGRDGRPYKERNEGTITVPVSAVAIAWRIAKERRDASLMSRHEEAQQDLDALHDAGFDSHLPTLAEVREVFNRE